MIPASPPAGPTSEASSSTDPMPAASAGPAAAAAAAAARAESVDFGGDGDKEDESGSEEADLDAPQGRHFQKGGPPASLVVLHRGQTLVHMELNRDAADDELRAIFRLRDEHVKSNHKQPDAVLTLEEGAEIVRRYKEEWLKSPCQCQKWFEVQLMCRSREAGQPLVSGRCAYTYTYTCTDTYTYIYIYIHTYINTCTHPRFQIA